MKRFATKLLTAVSLAMFLFVGTQSFAQTVINIALANNPISQALNKLAKEKYKAAGVTVNIAVLPENDLRQKLTTEASTGGTSYDMFFIGPYEAASWAKNGWLENLEPYFSLGCFLSDGRCLCHFRVFEI